MRPGEIPAAGLHAIAGIFPSPPHPPLLVGPSGGGGILRGGRSPRETGEKHPICS
jgi:hypothetical protein